jgi:pimeloyl-ACP methyl ester carboxylesterase
MWNPLVKALQDDYLFIIPDLAGHGKSGLTGEILTMEEQAEMLRNLLDFQGIHRAILIGHSMGGYISLAFAELFPDRLHGLLLLNSHPYADGPAKIQSRRIGAANALQSKIRFLSGTIPGFFADYNRDKLNSTIEKLIAEASVMPARGISGALLGMMTRKDRSTLFFDSSQTFARCWIISADDPLINPGKFEEEAMKNPHIFFRKISGGHMSYVENPGEMIDAVKKFLRNIKT